MDPPRFQIQITEEDLHVHLKARMSQRGVMKEEIERALNEGREAADARPGTLGKTLTFPYQKEWEGRFYEEKEVNVYWKVTAGSFVLLTVKARYGKNFPRGEWQCGSSMTQKGICSISGSAQ